MRILLDEDVPVQLIEPLRRLLPEHDVRHVEELAWKGKKDSFLLPDAAAHGFDAILTNDSGQLSSPEESRAIRDARIHHVRYSLTNGLDGLATAMGAVMASIRPIMKELAASDRQLLVNIQAIGPGRRHKTVDPLRDPPPYWPAGRTRQRRPRT